MIYVDSNVIIDVFTRDPRWHGWSQMRLIEGVADGALVTGHVVVAELAHRAASIEELVDALDKLELRIVDLDIQSAFVAGRAYREYRRRGGERTSILPDFVIGGHAMALGATLLTRDARRFRSYFPELNLITPKETDD